MFGDKRKPPVGIGLLAIAKKKAGVNSPSDSTSMGDESMDSGGDDKARMAVDDLADLVGCPEDKRDAFFSAFQSAVKAMDDDSGMGDEGDTGTAAV